MPDNVIKFPIIPRIAATERAAKLADYNTSAGLWAAYSATLKIIPDIPQNAEARGAIKAMTVCNKNTANQLALDLDLPSEYIIF